MGACCRASWPWRPVARLGDVTTAAASEPTWGDDGPEGADPGVAIVVLVSGSGTLLQALIDAATGAHGVRDALAYGVKVTGTTCHVVDAGVDTGPIIEQRVVAVLDDDTEETLHERIKVQERDLLVDVVGRMAREGFSVDGRRVRLG